MPHLLVLPLIYLQPSIGILGDAAQDMGAGLIPQRSVVGRLVLGSVFRRQLTTITDQLEENRDGTISSTTLNT